MRTRLAILLVVGALAACSSPVGSPSAAAQPTASAIPTAWSGPTVSLAPHATATDTAASPAETAQPEAALGAPTEISGELLARLTVYPDVYAGPVPPLVSIYADGHVVTSRWVEGIRVRFHAQRLDPGGLRTVVTEFDAALSSFQQPAATADPSAGYGGGFATYVLSVRRGDRLATVRTTNASIPANARAIVDLGDRWLQGASPAPTDMWLDTTPSPFVPTHWSLWLRPDGQAASPAPEAAVLTALIGDPTSFGTPTDGSSWWTRCGIVDRATAQGIVAALRAAGVSEADLMDRLDVDFRTGSGFVNVVVVPALPDETRVCLPETR